MTYESQVERPCDDKRKSRETEPYDAEGQRRLALASERWAIGELGGKVRLTDRYICKSEGRLHHIEIGRESGTEEGWRGISPGYCYLEITGKYMGGKWISHFDLYGSLMWRNKQHMKTWYPEESEKNEIRLVREEVCNGAGNPLLITTETWIQYETTPEFEEQTHGVERYGRKWLN